MLLAFDTATPHVSVALHTGRQGNEQADVVWEQRSELTMKHGEQLAPLIDAALRDCGVDREELTGIAVGTGPGPFTGLRVGLVTARILAHVLTIPVHGVCTLDALAFEALHTRAVQGPFLVATDARRKEVYLAEYDAAGARIRGPLVDRPDQVASELPVVGAGAVLYPDAFPHPAGPQRPSAGWLARAAMDDQVEVTNPEPLYLRRPDATMPAAPKRVS